MESGVWKELEIEFNGKPVKGSYCVSGKLVTVRTIGGRNSTQLGDMPPEAIAKVLLRELARGGKAD
jgi:hypothetical protein